MEEDGVTTTDTGFHSPPPSLPESARIVIVGAGIVGASIAYHLALAATAEGDVALTTPAGCDPREVVVVDQGPLFTTGGSTSHAPGGLLQVSPSKTMTQFAAYTAETFAALDREVKLESAAEAVDPESGDLLRPLWFGTGSVELAHTKERWLDIQRKVGIAHAYGIDAQLLDPQQTKEKLPILDSSRVLGSLHVKADGITKPLRAVRAMAKVAQRKGVRFFGNTKVIEFITELDEMDPIGERRRVVAVKTDKGIIKAERVVVACGIWGCKVGSLANVSIPLVPMEHPCAWTVPLPEYENNPGISKGCPGSDPNPPRDDSRPADPERECESALTRHQDSSLYLRQYGKSMLIGSYRHPPLPVPSLMIDSTSTEAEPTHALRPFTPNHFEEAWNSCKIMFPSFGRTVTSETTNEHHYRDGFNGIFSFTADGYPLLGEVSSVRGFFSAMAVWVTHAGGVGRVIAELLRGEKPYCALHECDINRFDKHQLSPSYVFSRSSAGYSEVYDIHHPEQPPTDEGDYEFIDPLKGAKSIVNQTTTNSPIRRSPFHKELEALGAVFFERRGWKVAQWYESNAQEAKHFEADANVEKLFAEIVEEPSLLFSRKYRSEISVTEHLIARSKVALFDMSTLTKVILSGRNVVAFLQRLTSKNIDRTVGSVTYALLLTPEGTIRSDITVTRLAKNKYQIGCNGLLDIVWFKSNLPDDGSVYLEDVSSSLLCLGVWGPRTRDLMSKAAPNVDWSTSKFPYYTAKMNLFIGDVPIALAQRVSYAGELGWELYASVEYASRLWERLWSAGQQFGVRPAGRAALESLRIEKGYRLWGLDMNTDYDPFEAGLQFAIDFNKVDFVGRDALIERKKQTLQRKLSCLALENNDHILLGKEAIYSTAVEETFNAASTIGYVTSAQYCASVKRSLAYAYLPESFAKEGSKVIIKVFDRFVSATVCYEPVFDPKSSRLRA